MDFLSAERALGAAPSARRGKLAPQPEGKSRRSPPQRVLPVSLRPFMAEGSVVPFVVGWFFVLSMDMGREAPSLAHSYIWNMEARSLKFIEI